MIDAVRIASIGAMGSRRGVLYPGEHLASYLRPRVEEAMATSVGLKSVSAVARWLHVDRTGLHHYMSARRLPGSADEVRKLARLPGADEASIREAMRLDKLQALAVDEEFDEQALVRLAAKVARAAGLTADEVIELLEQTDPEDLEQAARSR